MKTVEYLFPEMVNIFGEYYNVEYLSRCNPEIEVIRTHHKETPAFVNGDVDMVYLGCASENKQEMMLDILMPYKERIKELIDGGTVFLVTGNALELFGRYIKDGERTVPALGIWDYYADRCLKNGARHNSHFLASVKADTGDITVIGHKSQFSFAYGEYTDISPMADIKYGIGINPDSKSEGFRKNNFFATYSLGPFLILNPYFCKYLLRLLGLDDSLCFEKQAIEAFEYRKNEITKAYGGK